MSSTNYTGDIGWQLSNGAGSPNALQPNTQYTARWRVNASKSQRLYPAVGNWAIVGGAANSGTGTLNASSGQIIVASNTPAEQWITFTTGANTVACKVLANIISGPGASPWAAGDWVEISELIVVQGASKPNYADGTRDDWVWNGAQNNSTSTGPAL